MIVVLATLVIIGFIIFCRDDNDNDPWIQTQDEIHARQ